MDTIRTMTTPYDLMRAAMISETAGWTDEQRMALLHRLDREATRLTVRAQHPTAGALAQSIDTSTKQTDALEVIDEALEWALSTPNARLAVSVPPQSGKSQRLSVWGIIRALVQDPGRRCVIASYSDYLARTHSRTARNLIREHGTEAADPLTGAPLPDRLGLSLADDKSAAGNWKLAGHRGGCYAVGVGGSLTGQPAELLVIDDPLKGMAEADSQVEREKVITWWESVAQTRLAPGAPVIIIATRWHEKDLIGHVLAQDELRAEPMWRVLNIPAIAVPGVPDALDREPGEAMESARGLKKTDYERIRDEVGERVWSALYLGQPTPAQGGLFSQEWFDRHRTPTVPDNAAARLVAIDPAETGNRDEAGIIAMTVTADGRAWVTDDQSGKYTSDQWARKAVLLALQTRAGELSYEAFATKETYGRIIEDAWRRIRRESQHLAAAGGDVSVATLAYGRDEYAPADALAALQEVDEVQVPDQADPPFVIRPWRMPGDKTARAAGTRQAASTGRLRMVGTHPELERQSTQWQAGQSSPDRLDALVQAFERAMQLVGAQAQLATPTQVQGSQPQSTGMSNFWHQQIG